MLLILTDLLRGRDIVLNGALPDHFNISHLIWLQAPVHVPGRAANVLVGRL